MTVHYGFFNSSNGDRVYDAEDFSRFFDGIIFDGVYSAVGNRFNVEAASGLVVTVDTGRAWFNHTWTFNDQKLALQIPAADTVYSRIDAVVIEVNKDQRKNFIKVVKGTASGDPKRPTLTKTDAVIQYALAYVTIPANATQVQQSNIVYVVESSETPLASALNLAGLPSGGTIGQVLAKKSSTSGDVGWYNVDALPIDKWYLTDGITENNVLAAFKFVHRLNDDQALTQVNEKNLVNGSTPIKLSTSGSPVRNNDTGYYVPFNSCLDSSALRACNISAIVMRISDVSLGSNSRQGYQQHTALPLTGNFISGSNFSIWLSMPYTRAAWYYWATGCLATSGPGGTTNGGNPWDPTTLKTSGTQVWNGVIGYTKSGGVTYRNGNSLTMNNLVALDGGTPSGFVATQNSKLIGGNFNLDGNAGSWDDLDNWAWGNSFRVQYFAAYTGVDLSATQHTKLYQNIESDMQS